MSEQSTCRPEDLREAVNIHTRKVTDSCRDKDCIEDLRVYLTRESQALLDASAGAKARCAELVYAYIDVEPVAFNRNHYCIDITFYYRILARHLVRPGCFLETSRPLWRGQLCQNLHQRNCFERPRRPDAAFVQSSYRCSRGSGSHDPLCQNPGGLRLSLRRAYLKSAPGWNP